MTHLDNMRWVEDDPIPEEVVPQKTMKERIAEQRQANWRDSDENWAYVQANEARYAQQRAETLAKRGGKQADDEMDKKWLTVPKGQLTFDSEGSDDETVPYFSRKVHIPNNNGTVIGNSGVTIGRGLDLGTPPSGANGQRPATIDLNQAFQEASLNKNLASWLLSTKGITKRGAYDKIQNCGLKTEELTITRKQQYKLFNIVYAFMEEKTRILMTKPDVAASYGYIHWDSLPINVQEVLTDLTYRGDNTPNSRALLVPILVDCQLNNDYSEFKKAINDKNSYWTQVPSDRRIKRFKHVENI